MNQKTDTLSDEAFAQHIIQSARTIQPDAGFATELEQKLMQSPPQKSRASRLRLIRLLGTVAAVLTLVVVATFNVPPLRAIAQEIIGLLIRFEKDETTGYMMEPPTTQQLFASLEKAEADLGRDFVVPQYFPSLKRANKVIPVEFEMLTYIPEVSTTHIRYGFVLNSMWSLTFMQIPSEVYHKTGTRVGASAEIEPVRFNFRGKPVSAEFVKGGWYGVIDVEDTDELLTATPSSINLEWTTESKEMYLIWEADGVVYQILTSESTLLQINRDELLRIAESIE